MPERNDDSASVVAASGQPADSTPSGFVVERAYDAHAPALFGFAVNALRDRSLAEDCVQETFLRAWRARERYVEHRASERTWLFAILRNVITDALRARARMPRIGGDEELESLSAHTPDPLHRLQIVEAMARLTQPQREVIVAVHLEGRTYQELSDATAIPVTTWRTRAFHALRAMRRHLEGTEEADASSR